MPEYIYLDKNKHTKTMVHRMLYGTAVVCEKCGEEMGRIPQVTRVNWNGNRAVSEIHPNIKNLIDEAPKRRDEYAAIHEAHEKRSAKK